MEKGLKKSIKHIMDISEYHKLSIMFEYDYEVGEWIGSKFHDNAWHDVASNEDFEEMLDQFIIDIMK